MIFDKRQQEQIIFYNGKNKQEVIEFFSSKCFGKYLIIQDDELHYKIKDYEEPKERTFIPPYNYIRFWYDEDAWWVCEKVSIEEYNKNFIEIKI